MAEFIQVEKNKYKIVGVLKGEDIKKINDFKNRTILILENTAGLSSQLISKINTDRVVFSIKGGLDYDKKKKYNEEHYIERTYVSPLGLRNIIKYFEYNESRIDPSWNDYEKAMFLYNALATDIDYQENYDNIQSKGVTERSLNGILYGKLVCAGFALVYKEMLDRVGIKCYYQNQKKYHDFNVIEIDGKKYGVDVTWDLSRDGKGCTFLNFGSDADFYSRDGHKLYQEEFTTVSDWENGDFEKIYDEEEEVFELSEISKEDLQKYYDTISPSIRKRKTFTYDLQEQSLETKKKFLPVDILKYNIKQEVEEEKNLYVIYRFLLKRGALQIDDNLKAAISFRCNYISDVSSYDRLRDLDLSVIGIDNYKINSNFGDIEFSDGVDRRVNYMRRINTLFDTENNMSRQEISELYNKLNDYLAKCSDKYIGDVDELLENYEYKPDEWDIDRHMQSVNIESKLMIIAGSTEHLIESGMSQEEVDKLTKRILDRIRKVQEPYISKVDNRDLKKEDLYFLENFLTSDFGLIRKVIEKDLNREISDEEFINLFSDVNYMIKILEQYIQFGASEKNVKIDDYDISIEELQNLLNKIIKEYQLEMLSTQMSEDECQEEFVEAKQDENGWLSF